MSSKSRTVKAWIAVSPIHEGANIYMPGGGFDFWESKKDAKFFGWKDDELVKATITYRKIEK